MPVPFVFVASQLVLLLLFMHGFVIIIIYIYILWTDFVIINIQVHVYVYLQHLCCSRVHMYLIAQNLMFLETCMAPLFLYAEVAGPLSHVPPVM